MPVLDDFPSVAAARRLTKSISILIAVAIAMTLAIVLPDVKATAQYPVIELATISPQFGQSGTSLELRVSGGNHLDQVDRLFFSDPRIIAEVITEEAAATEASPVAAQAPAAEAAQGATKDQQHRPKWGHFKVSIPADVAAGRYEVCAAGAYGISNPRAFCVTNSPVFRPEAVSQIASEPTALDDLLAADGKLVANHQATAARIDYFRLSHSGKEALRVGIDAQRIDSRMIAQLKLIASDGRVLQAARGADGFDPSITIPAGQSGSFIIAVHDFLFRGGESYFYGLRIGADDSNPTVATIGAAELESETLIPADDRLESITVPTFESVRAISLAEIAEPITLTPPCTVEAAFDPSQQDHIYDFDAEQASRLCIEVVSQRLGQPTDPRAIIERREVKGDAEDVWHAVANEDDPTVIGDAAVRLRSKDPVVQFTAPATATYRIRIRNLDNGQTLAGAPLYCLALRQPSPDFRLVAILPHPHNDAAQSRPRGCRLMRGDSQSIRVLAVRRDGFSAPIQLSIPQLPAGLTCRPVTLAVDQSEAHLTVSTSDDAASWIGELRVVGKATDGDRELSRDAAAATFIWGSGEQRDFIRSRLATRLMMSIAQEQQSPVSIRIGDEQAVEAKPGGSVSLSVALTRREGGAAPVILRPRNLPPGVTAAEVTIAADQSTGSAELNIAAHAKPGNYSLWFQAETKVKFKPIAQAEPTDLTVFIPSTTADIRVTSSP